MDARTQRLDGLKRQIHRIDQELIELSNISNRLTTWRLLTFVIGLVAIGLVWNISTLAGILVTLPALIIFIALIRVHRRIKQSIERHETYKAIKQQHIARMRINWQKLPESTATAPPDHPFAIDLDIVGHYSIHRLLDTTVSRGGSERLLHWLLTTRPEARTISNRRNRVKPLVNMSTFRTKLTMHATLSKGRGKWDGKRLIDWLTEETSQRRSALPLMILTGLAFINLTLIFLDAINVVSGLWVFSLILYVLIYAVYLRSSSDSFGEALTIKSELDKLTAVFNFIESFRFTSSSALDDLCAPFKQSDRKPTTQLRTLNSILAALSLRANPIFWFMVNLLIPWDAYFTHRLYANKGSLAKTLPAWLDVWYELEALSALATFEYLNPHYMEPHVNEEKSEISAKDMGHPLIPHEERVCNDYHIGQPHSVHIITGSNMSGKSSFLRTVGINLQLTYAGAVVASTAFETGLFRVFTCIKVTDSIVDGISYFYAEVQRLKALLDALDADSMPLFFLIDEIFRGTNNRERLIGSGSYIRNLANSRAYGLISTHDLELVQLESEINSIKNFHFREDIEEDRMRFDYVLKQGPSPTTNALVIMKQAGLPVDINYSTS